MKKTARCRDNCADVDLEEFRQRCQIDQVYIYSKVYTLLGTVHPSAFVKEC